MCFGDDGSLDKSQKKCKKYAQEDSRFVVVNKNNGGVDKARFDGLGHAKGEFVMFVDSDDWLESNALEKLMSPMLEFETDIVVGQTRNVYHVCGVGLRDWRKIIPHESNKLILHDDMMENYYISFFGINLLSVSMWATLYRRSVIHEAKLQPSGLSFGEDLVFNMKLMPYVRKYYILDEIVYNYRIDGFGASSKYLDRWLENARLLFEIKMSQIEDLHYTKAIKPQLIEFVNYLKTYVKNCLLYDESNIEERKNALKRDSQKYNFGGKIRALLTMEYKDKEVIEVLQDNNIDEFFGIMQRRLLHESLCYRMKHAQTHIRNYFHRDNIEFQ